MTRTAKPMIDETRGQESERGGDGREADGPSRRGFVGGQGAADLADAQADKGRFGEHARHHPERPDDDARHAQKQPDPTAEHDSNEPDDRPETYRQGAARAD